MPVFHGNDLLADFIYTTAIIKELEKSLSAKRLSRYVTLTEGDVEQAIKWHLWNSALGAALHVPMQNFELLLRNALNDQLSAKFGECWYEELYSQFHPIFQRQISSAKDELTKQARLPLQSSAVIAQFTFGAWINLIHHRYDRLLWKFCLYKAFSNQPTIFNRKLLKSSLEQIRGLRNRIAHHEPICNRELDKDFKLILEVATWISPLTANWIEHHSQFQDIWSNPPK